MAAEVDGRPRRRREAAVSGVFADAVDVDVEGGGGGNDVFG